mgnify:CR=1 FL=1
MAIKLKSRREIELMKKAGALVAQVLSKLKEIAEPGITTGFLNRVALDMTEQAGAKALFKGVKSPYARTPFPGAICASLNEQIVHGIPSDKVVLKEGDILSIDFGIKLGGYCGDSAITFGIGEISEENEQLIEVTRKCLEIAEKNMKPGLKWSEIAGKMQSFVESNGFSVVTEYVGHGIGRNMHEDPKVPNFVSDDLLRNDIYLKEGMVLAVEPMINAGCSATKTLKDGWTVVTKDSRCSAHFEHTLAVIDNKCEILTLG